MRYVAAYLLAVLGGNTQPTAKDLKKILDTVGVDVDNTALDKVISELKGKDIEELMAEGRTKLASVPSGGGGGGGAGGAAAAPEAEKEEKKEEKKEESEEEEDDDMGFGLFD